MNQERTGNLPLESLRYQLDKALDSRILDTEVRASDSVALGLCELAGREFSDEQLYTPDSSRKLGHRIELAKRLAFTAVLIASAAFPTGSAANESIALSNVEVVAHSPLPPYTGVVETWVVLTVRVKSTQQNLLVPYFSADQYLPDVGAACDFIAHREAINGIAGNQVVSGTFTVVDHTQCHDAHS